MKMISHTFEGQLDNCYMLNPTISFEEKHKSDLGEWYISNSFVQTAGEDLEIIWNQILDELSNNKDLHFSTPLMSNHLMKFPYSEDVYFVHYHYKIDRIVVKRPNQASKNWEICVFA